MLVAYVPRIAVPVLSSNFMSIFVVVVTTKLFSKLDFGKYCTSYKPCPDKNGSFRYKDPTNAGTMVKFLNP